ncbi:MAG: DNA polymerase [Bacilli bacterium]
MENLNEMLYKYRTNIKNYIVENYIQEKEQIIKNKKSIYSFDTETSKQKIGKDKYKCITYATMYMDIDDETDTCYLNRSLDDFLVNAENNSDHYSIFYAHNGSGFDYKNLLHTLIKHKYKIIESEYTRNIFSTYEKVKLSKRKADDMSKTIDIKYKDGKIYEMICIVKTVYLIPTGRGKNKTIKELSVSEALAEYKDLEQLKKYRVDKKLIFRDSMLLLAGTLEKLCADNFKLYLPKEELDYSIFRDKDTELKPNEYFYCYADVFGLKYLIKNVILKEYHFSYLSYKKNSECFIYKVDDLENQYNSAETIKNRFKYIEVNTEDIQDRFDISDLKIKLGDKLTSASYSFYILKRFLHYEVCKTLIYHLNNPTEIKTEFQKYLIRQYMNNYEKRRLKLGEKIKFTAEDSYRLIFPKLTKIIDDNNKENATWFIKGAYHGGRCFTGKNFYNMYRKGKFYTYYRGNGSTIDANSLYPTQMRFKPMPYGYYEIISNEDFANLMEYYLKNRISFIKIKTDGRVTLKQGKFPMQRVTNNICEGFKGSESFVTNIRKIDNDEIPISMNLTLNSIDFINFFDSYNVTRYNIKKVLSFRKTKGLFNSFIDYFYEIKKNSKGTERNNAKLILNSSYGKFGTKPVSNDYEIFLNENGIMEYSKKYIVYDNDNIHFSSQARINHNDNIEELNLVEEPFYMPVATVVTAEGRSDLKHVCEKVGMENFLYCDTDSLHSRLSEKEITEKLGNLLDNKELGKWALESEFTEAQYLGAKRYSENIAISESKNIKLDNFYYNYWDVKCCGIPGKTQRKIAKAIDNFDYCELSPKEFKKLLTENKLEITENYLYKNILTNKIIKGAFVVNKSRESVNGVCITQQPYLITNDLYLYGSDID